MNTAWDKLMDTAIKRDDARDEDKNNPRIGPYMKQVMTPRSERWEEFCERLEGDEGCDFTADHTWKCYSDHRFSKAILKEMGFDIKSSIKLFKENGGGCDCEVLFNVTEKDY